MVYVDVKEDEMNTPNEIVDYQDNIPILIEDLGNLYPNEGSKQKKRYGIYQCQYCGKEFKAQTHHIKSGGTKSCGCLKSIGKHFRHGLCLHPLYDTWNQMNQRCSNPNHKRYKDYGGRGIKVCVRWLDINNFIEDMYPSWEEGLSLDRINVNGNYELNNCRWTTSSIQSRNTRDVRVDNQSGFRGVSWYKRDARYLARITINNKRIHLGYYQTALEAGKAYERYVRLNNLEHNFTPALTEEEIEGLKQC